MKHRILWTTVCASALLMPAAVHAQDAAPAETAADAAPTELGEILVTAQRRSERLRDVPLSITAQSGADLERSGISNLKELGIAVPGLAFTTQGGFAAPTVRGVQSTVAIGGADSPVAIYVDGVYQPNQLANLFDLPDVERVEVLKGPQGTLFGRNATAGAIAIHTVKPEFQTKGRITVSDAMFFGGSANASHNPVAKGYVSGPLIDDLLAGSIAGYYEYIDGYLTNDVTGGRTGRVKKGIIRGKLLLEPQEGISFLLTGFYSDRFDNASMATQPLRGNSNAAFYPDGIVSTKPWHVAGELKDGVSTIDTNTLGGSLKADFKIDGAGTLTSLTAYQDTEAVIFVNIDAAYSPTCLAAFACINYLEDYPEKTFQQELNFSSEKFGALSFVAGAFYYRDSHFMGNSINPPLNPDGSPNRDIDPPVFFGATVKTRAYAGFGEVNYDVSDRLHLIGGLRYSHEKRYGLGNNVPRFPTTGALVSKSWTPRASIRYEISPATNVYATYSKGFKSGVVDTTGQTNVFARPEKLTAYEVDIKIGTPTFNFNGAAFYYDYKDLQAQFFDGVGTILANAADAELYGFEADGTVSLNENFQLRATAAWLPGAKYKNFPTGVAFALPNTPGGMSQVVVDASGDRMLKAPKFTGSLSLNYGADVPAGRLEANANIYYSSDYHFDLLKRVETKDYVTLNAQASLAPGNGGLKFTVFGKNLTNKAYFTSALLGNQTDAPVYAPPRQVGLSIEYSF